MAEDVRRFFASLGVEKIPPVEHIENIEEVCEAPQAIGCVKNGRVYVKKGLGRLLEESTEVHELSHKLLNLKEVGAYLLEYFFLRKKHGDVLNSSLLSLILLRSTYPLYLEKGTFLPGEALYVSYLFRKRRYPYSYFIGRESEGLVKLLTKVIRHIGEEDTEEFYRALYRLRVYKYREIGELAYRFLEGYRRLTEEEKRLFIEGLLKAHAYGRNLLSENRHNAHHHENLLAEIEAFLFFVNREAPTVSNLKRRSVINKVLERLVDLDLHNNNLTRFLEGMMNRPPAEG